MRWLQKSLAAVHSNLGSLELNWLLLDMHDFIYTYGHNSMGKGQQYNETQKPSSGTFVVPRHLLFLNLLLRNAWRIGLECCQTIQVINAYIVSVGKDNRTGPVDVVIVVG